MNLWLKPDWDRGYEAGRKAGLEEAHRYQHQCNADLETRAKLREEGRELEQERIIKLLDEQSTCFHKTGVITVAGIDDVICNCDGIALIEGEK
jgi:hypothetical protein